MLVLDSNSNMKMTFIIVPSQDLPPILRETYIFVIGTLPEREGDGTMFLWK